MIVLGPVIFGFLFGVVLGSQIKTDPKYDVQLTVASFVAIIIAGLLMAWQLGQYPFYDDVPVSTAFICALIGALVGKLLFARGSAN